MTAAVTINIAIHVHGGAVTIYATPRQTAALPDPPGEGAGTPDDNGRAGSSLATPSPEVTRPSPPGNNQEPRSPALAASDSIPTVEPEEPTGNEGLAGERGSAEWQEDCLRWRGKVLTGRYGHWCPDWDYLPVDETTPEWPCPCSASDGWHETNAGRSTPAASGEVFASPTEREAPGCSKPSPDVPANGGEGRCGPGRRPTEASRIERPTGVPDCIPRSPPQPDLSTTPS